MACGLGTRSARALPREPVAAAPDGLQSVRPERSIDLLAQAPDVGIDNVRTVVIGLIPSALEQLEPREDLLGAPHERLKQEEPLCGQIEIGGASPDATLGGIEP